MARIVKLVSDITGVEALEEEFIQLVVRQHPATTTPRKLDVLPAEVEKLKGADNLVVLEIKDNGNSREVVMSLAEFRKLVGDDVVKTASGTRGRPVGFKPAPKGK